MDERVYSKHRQLIQLYSPRTERAFMKTRVNLIIVYMNSIAMHKFAFSGLIDSASIAIMIYGRGNFVFYFHAKKKVSTLLNEMKQTPVISEATTAWLLH